MHIVTKNREYDTTDIILADKPSSSGKWFINDAEGHGIYASDNQLLTQKVYDFAIEQTANGKAINTRDLKKQEYYAKKELQSTPEATVEQTQIDSEWQNIEAALKNHIQDETRLEKEREELLQSISKMQKDGASPEVIELARRVLASADRIHDRHTQRTEDTATVSQMPDESHIIYRLENHLITRAAALFQAGFVSAYDKLSAPLRYLHEKSLSHQIAAETKELQKNQKKLEQYIARHQKKLEKRLEKTNAYRAKQGRPPLPEGTTLYHSSEQAWINQLSLMIQANETMITDLQHQLEQSRSAHQDRQQFLKDHIAVAKNEKILEKHKKVIYQTGDMQQHTETGRTPTAEAAEAVPSQEAAPIQESPNDAQKTAPVDAPATPSGTEIPIMAPDGTILGTQTISDSTAEKMAEGTNIQLEDPPIENRELTEPSVIETSLEDRFAQAKQESAQNKELSTARFLYHVLETRLPANAYIEFECNGAPITAQCNAYGDLTVKKYDFESATFKPASKDDVIKTFSTDVRGFESAIRSQLGDILILGAEQKKPDKQETELSAT